MLPPSALVVKDQRGQKRVGELVAALMRHSIDSHTSLAAAWRHKPRALQAEIGLWLPKQQHRTLEALWVSLLAEALSKSGPSGAQQKVKMRKHKQPA